jgi:uncharacterized membrane protein
MPTVTASKIVHHDVHTVYDQWTQFEEFPRFMKGVERVQQLDDKHLHWVAGYGGSMHEWDAEITDQVPDERIAWRSTDGAVNSGSVTFRPTADGTTEVTVRMGWEPESAREKLGGALGFDDRTVKADLRRLERYLDEHGGHATGGWRGEQH